jgi:hypothetical protein
MPTYVVKVRLRGIEPVTRHFGLDEVVYGLGFFPWRPGVPPEDEDIGAVYSQWEYAGNHPLNPEAVKMMIESRLGSEIQPNIDVTIARVTVTAG